LTQDCQIVQGHDQVIKAPPHILEMGGPEWAGLGRPVPRNAPKFIVVTSGQSGPARAGHDQSRPAEYTVNNVCDVGWPGPARTGHSLAFFGISIFEKC